eukprot:jgi/Bigna1/83139/fgenesh1_pg.102_\
MDFLFPGFSEFRTSTRLGFPIPYPYCLFKFLGFEMWAVARQRCARARAIRLGRCIRGISSDRRKVLHMGHSHGGGGGGHGHSHSPTDLDNLPEEAGKKAQRITWIGMGANAGLCVAKGGIGFYSGSASLVADAAHSVSDMVSDVVALIAVKIGRKPADSKQPYGYGHYETLGTLAICAFAGLLKWAFRTLGSRARSDNFCKSTLLSFSPSGSVLLSTYECLGCWDAGGAGFGSAFHGVDHLIPLMAGKHVEPVCMVPAAMACALVSVAIKEWLYQVTVKVGKEARSQVLIANAWHHRTDAFSSIVALLGVGGSAMVGKCRQVMLCAMSAGNLFKAQLMVEEGFPYLDPIGAIMVSGMIMKTGVEIGWEAVHHLVDAQVNERVLDEVKAIGRDLSEEGHIKNVHNLDHRSPTVENEAHPDREEANDNDGLKPASSDSHHPIAKGSSRSAAIGKKDDEDEHKSSADFPMSSSQAAGSDAPSPSPSPSPSPPPPTAAAAVTAAIGTEPSPRRTQQEIEADILEVFASVQENQKITEENHHHSSYVLAEKMASYISSHHNKKISLVLDSGVTVAAAKMAAVVLREEILKSIDDIGEVDIHMELLHGMLKGEMHEIHRARHAK